MTAGDPIELECHVKGSSPIKVTWSKGSREIRSAGNLKLRFVNNVACLAIMKTEQSDAGVYTCKAANEAGTDACNVEVRIQG